jgi:hypothetical protein
VILLVEQVIRKELNSLQLKEKMVGQLVKKQKRGTYQALDECTKEEQDLVTTLVQYMEDWLIQEILSGNVNKLIKKELQTQLIMELSRRGFDQVIKEVLS